MTFMDLFLGKPTQAETDLIEPAKEERRVVAIFGAGASMAAGGVGVADIFQRAFTSRFARYHKWYKPLRRFLRDVFCVPECAFGECKELPDIILVLSLVDLAIDRGESLVGRNPTARRQAFTHAELVEIREKLEGLIIRTVLDPYFEQFRVQRKPIARGDAARWFVHEIFLDHLHRLDPNFSLISMNYDMYVERAVMQHLAWLRSDRYDPAHSCPTYHIAFEPSALHTSGVRPLHKLHGSCDWAHCSGCGRITLLYTSRYLRERHLKGERGTLEDFMNTLLGGKTACCERCGSQLRPVIVPPTLMKNYSNSHIRHVWNHAERALQAATDIYFVGYGMATDDLEFIAMLKRHTQGLDRDRIHVITPDDRALWRYHSVFGRRIHIERMRFEEWVEKHCGDIVPDYCHYARSRAGALNGRNGAAASPRRPAAESVPVPA